MIISGYGGNPFISHSLSWSRKSDISSNGMMFAKVWTPEDPRVTKLLTNNIDKHIDTIESNNKIQNSTWTSTTTSTNQINDALKSNDNNCHDKYDNNDLSIKSWSSNDTIENDSIDISKVWSHDNHNVKIALTKYDIEKHMTIDCVAVQS